MALIAPPTAKITPSYTEPGLLLTLMQPSGVMSLFSTSALLPRLKEGDLYVYAKVLDVRTQAAVSQSSSNDLPSADLQPRLIGTPTYNFMTKADYNHHDINASSNWDIPLSEAYRLALRQGIFQSIRLAALYGVTPSSGEGLINTSGATTASLTTDSFNNSTLSTWDAGQLSQFFMTLIANLLTRTNQFGAPQRIVMLMPQRDMALLQMVQIVQLTSYQRIGAGSETSLGVVQDISKRAGVDVEFHVDDTLIGKGSGGTDAIIIAIPEVKKQPVPGLDINPFQTLEPGLNAVTAIYTDKAAPTEITSPLPQGAIDVLMEQRTTSGIAWRGEAVTILSAQFS